jgi:hypothetical protein
LGTLTSFLQDLVPQMECQPALQQSRARTRVRDYDGRTRQLERNDPTKTAAGTAVKIAVRDRGPRLGGSLLRMTSACSQG